MFSSALVNCGSLSGLPAKSVSPSELFSTLPCITPPAEPNPPPTTKPAAAALIRCEARCSGVIEVSSPSSNSVWNASVADSVTAEVAVALPTREATLPVKPPFIRAAPVSAAGTAASAKP